MNPTVTHGTVVGAEAPQDPDLLLRPHGEAEQGQRSSKRHLRDKQQQHRRRGQAGGYSPGAGSTETLAQRPGSPLRRPARRGEAAGENPAGAAAGSAQVTQSRRHSLRPLPAGPQLPKLAPRAGRRAAPARSSPASHSAANEERACAPRGSGASGQWTRAAEGEGRRAGRRRRGRGARWLVPSFPSAL